jgi:hypothetical protein
MATAAARPSLEATVTRYRREAARTDGAAPELEIRLQGLDFANWSAIYTALLGKGPGELSQTVSVIMSAPGAAPLRAARIREIRFEGGVKAGERAVQKTPLLIPYRVANSGGLSYTVALSAERVGGPGQISDESALVRLKARVSFALQIPAAAEPHAPLDWRVDMTVARQLTGGDAQATLKTVIAQMFATSPPMRADNVPRALRLDDDANPAPRSLYAYEVEVEYVGSGAQRDALRPADVTAAAETVLRLANAEYVRDARMQAEIYRAAHYIVKAAGYLQRFATELGLKRLLPQAVAVTRADYRAIYPPRDYYLTDKADGKRALALVHDRSAVVVADALHEFAPPGDARPALDTILDGELVERDGVLTFYAFDVIAVAGEDLTRAGFGARLGRLAEGVALAAAAGVPAVAKAYVHVAGGAPAELERAFRQAYESPRPYAVDGVILVEPGKPYPETANYKWKPAEHNTIDMLVRRAPPAALGRPPFADRPGHKLHFLFVGIRPDLRDRLGLQPCPGYAALFGEADRREPGAAPTHNYQPIQFSPSDAPMAYLYQHPDGAPDVDGAIAEFRCGGGCQAAGAGGEVAWELVRRREDRKSELATRRYFGNDFEVAEFIWLNYVDPFPFDQLWNGPGLDYFMRPKSGIYRAQTAVTSFVKTTRIATLKHAAWVVDVGAGKGQDLGRYLEAEVRNLIAVDQDRAALSELVRRKYSFAKQGAVERRGPRRGATTVRILVADARDPAAETLARLGAAGLPAGGADALVCNLAVHYFMASAEAMRNFAALARGAVRVGGSVVLTVLNGASVHAAFLAARVEPGATLDFLEGVPPIRKYSLRRQYKSDTLEVAGQAIGVLLPFSDGQYYEEYLVNPKALEAEFAARGFELSVAASVAESIPDFAARNSALAEALTPGDKKYLALYGELVFVRVK